MKRETKHTRFTNEELTKMCQLRLDGLTMKEIASEIGCSISTVAYWLYKCNINVVNRKWWGKEKLNRLVTMYNDGVSFNDIALEFDKTKDNIHAQLYLLRKKGKVSYR